MIGKVIGPYQVLAKLGEGGMGEVYRARDARLNRDVALKVLPDLFAKDPERLARFSREAQALAALNHPNIAAIYGIEDNALVMELVEGEDLSVHIARGAMPLSDALPIARQIADALEAAHEQGIIHRDLKPANIKVRPDGTVKILDFGLAKAMASDGATSDAANSPTLTARATQMGMIIGTAAYMAPEQAKGKAVDRRADIWAFGVVLYEMLTGRRAFDPSRASGSPRASSRGEGDTVAEVLASVLRDDVSWDALPSDVPASLRRLLLRCLERDPRLRLRDIGEARVLLTDPASLREPPVAAPASESTRPARVPLLPWIIAAAAVTGAAASVTTPMFRAEPAAQPVQFKVSYPRDVRPMSNGSDYQGGQISPDGRYVAFSGADTKTARVGIYLRSMEAAEATLIKGTEGGRYPFWAPTSRTIAFYAQGKLYRVDIDGSSLLLICDAPTGGWGGAWNRDDIIIAGVTDPGPLVKVSAKGGDTPTPVTKITLPENDHDWPQFLPDGRNFIYTAWTNTFTGTASTYVASLDNQDQKLLFKDLFDPIAYADPGFILFIRNGTLFAQPFNPGTLELQGAQVQLASNAMGPISSSADGAISYTTGIDAAMSRLAWVNRDGSDERSLTGSGFYRDPAMSPDGTRIAYARKDSFNGALDVYVRDIATGSEIRLTYDPADDRSPVWSPDSKEIIFSAARNPHGLYRKNANGSGAERPLTVERMPQIWSYQWNPDGYIMAYGDTEGSWDIWKVSLTDPKPTPLLTSRTLNEARGAVSPDGKWLAYDARETARFEVFLTTFPPSASAGKLSVTTEGGAEPKWSKDGKELFYVSSATGALMSVPVTLSDPPTFGTHRQVHPGPLLWGWSSSHSFDLDQKTGRVVLEILEERGDLTVLLGWRALLRK